MAPALTPTSRMKARWRLEPEDVRPGQPGVRRQIVEYLVCAQPGPPGSHGPVMGTLRLNRHATDHPRSPISRPQLGVWPRRQPASLSCGHRGRATMSTSHASFATRSGER